MADKLFGFLAKSAAILTLGLLFGILASLVVGAWPAITEYGLGFLTSTTWDPVENASLLPWLSATALLHIGGQDRAEHHQTPHAVHDGGHGSQQFDGGAQRAFEPGR